MIDFILSLLSARNVDRIIASLTKLVAKLEAAEEKLLEEANKHADKAVQVRADAAAKVAAIYAARDRAYEAAQNAANVATAEADKAYRVAVKIKELVS